MRTEWRPESRPSRNGELAEIASSSGRIGRSRSHTVIARSGAADAHVHVQAERVVAPGHVLQPLLDPPVVLGVDDLLLLPGAPGVRAGRRPAAPRARRRAGTAARALRAGEPRRPARSPRVRSGSRSRIGSARRPRTPPAPGPPPAASDSSSKRCTSERVPGSRIANSSSSPTVKSSEASKTSLARAISSMARSGRSRARRGGRPPASWCARSPRAAPGAGPPSS